MAADPNSPSRFLIPVITLGVPRDWSVGTVTFHPGENADRLIEATPAADSPYDFIKDEVHEILQSAGRTGSIAEVTTDSIDEALDAVRTALDVLRLFQHCRSNFRVLEFGLPGDVYGSTVLYVHSRDRSSIGAKHKGWGGGWTFDSLSYDDWRSSSAFRFLDEALRDPSASDGARRAVRGTQLFSRAVLEHRADLKMLGVAAALETWVLDRKERVPQTLRLARHAAWFSCGRHAQSLCGRDRPICPYLHLEPENKKDRKRLNALEALGRDLIAWRCSEWLRIIDWYDARSDAAHGELLAVDLKDAENAQFWAAHYLAEPILEWLGAHTDDPVGDLQQELDRVADPSGWSQMVDALDAENPPPEPPKSDSAGR